MIHKDLDTSSFKDLYDGKSYFLLDVRTPEEFSAGHLKGAVNINFYDQTFEENIDSLDKRKKYLVYCRSGGRSRQAMFLMRDLGFEEVFNLSGGILSWSEHDYEVEN
jgi:rhodanese-related sulfurtransferase